MAAGRYYFQCPPGVLQEFAIIGAGQLEIDRVQLRNRGCELVCISGYFDERRSYTGGQAAALLWGLTNPPTIVGADLVRVACEGASVTFLGEAWVLLDLVPGAKPLGPLSVAFVYR